jgi:hypothetical protein
MPDDSKIYIPRTVGKDQVVDDLILKFTHSREIDYRIPGICGATTCGSNEICRKQNST